MAEMWKIVGESGTEYVTEKCNHPGIYVVWKNGEAELCCDNPDNEIIYIQAENDQHPTCKKCGALLFPHRLPPAPHKRG